MSNKFTLEQLTEGIRSRNLSSDGKVLVEKWSRTGLLRGLTDQKREIMSRLLENQAAQLLRETSTLSTGAGGLSDSGDMRGFSNVAFPIVRRVFGGLVANELVSIQPMSLPSGLLFYLDYTYGSNVGGDSVLGTGAAGAVAASPYTAGQSIYNSPTGKGIRSGSLGVGGNYDLVGSSYSKVHKATTSAELCLHASGAWGVGSTLTGGAFAHATGTDGRMMMFDPTVGTLIEEDILNNAYDGTGRWQFLVFNANQLPTAFDFTNVKAFSLFSANTTTAGLGVIPQTIQGGSNLLNVRRLNQLGVYSQGVFTPNSLVDPASTGAALLVVVSGAYAPPKPGITAAATGLTGSYAIAASLDTDADGSTLTIPSFESDFGTTPSPGIPEIDIKIESIAVTATTRKLRAKWSPELAQDLNAFHSMDAEVELTQILSEQIALEIDREILGDLLTEARGANFYWSRAPGKFVNKETGTVQNLASTLATGPHFTGTVREWYETLTETIIDVANSIHRKTLRGSANFIVTSPEVCTMFENSVLYKGNLTIDGNGQVSTPFSIGAEAVGTLTNRFTVYKDPYFPRNKILVGYKGGSYLETGYVYAPYVPLIVTPTLFDPEAFTPRKGVMTRYGKKMVRADFFGSVTVMDMNII
jgi:hypothetical protein